MLKLLKKVNTKNVKVITVGILSTTLGFYIAGAFNSIGNFIIATIGAFFIAGLCAQAIDEEMTSFMKYTNKPYLEVKKLRHQDPAFRLYSYILCICVLYTVTAFTISMVSSGANAGDVEESTGLVATEDIPPQPEWKQRQWRYNMFMALIAPALLGIRASLGEPDKDRK